MYIRKTNRKRRAQTTPYVVICERCQRQLNWAIPRNEGVFCEECWAYLQALKEKYKKEGTTK